MLLPTLFLLPVMVVECLFLLSQPLGMYVMELFQTFIIKPCFDWCLPTPLKMRLEKSEMVVESMICNLFSHAVTSLRRLSDKMCTFVRVINVL